MRASAAGIKTKAPIPIMIKPKDIPFLYPILFKRYEAGSAISTNEM